MLRHTGVAKPGHTSAAKPGHAGVAKPGHTGVAKPGHTSIGGGNGAANTASAVPNSYQGRLSRANHLAS